MAVAISHTASFEYTAVDTDHDEAGVAIGTAAADRLVFVLAAYLGGASTHDINSMTIGGVSATRARRDSFEIPGIGAFASLEIWWALVPTGTTATISFTHDNSSALAKFSVYSVTGADTTAPVLDSDFATRTDALTNAVSASIDVPSQGGAIGLAYGVVANTSVSVAWTYLTEDLDNDHDIGEPTGFSTASISSAGAATGQAVTATFSESGSFGIFNRGLTVASLSAAAGATSTNGNASGSGALTGAARSIASTPASISGTGAATGAAAAVASTVFSASGTGTVQAVGEEVSESAAASASGTGTVQAAAASIASAAGFLAGSGGLSGAAPEIPVVTYPPVGGGGGFGPAPRPAKQPFRARKDKSRPKVITVRIGDWPENPQIILSREEDAERESFYRRVVNSPAESVTKPVDEEEQALMEILAFAA